MTGTALTLRALHDGERGLERDLLAAAERHRADHEIRHVLTDLARWSREHSTRLAETGQAYDLGLGGARDDPSPGVLGALREKAAETLGRRPPAGLLLLRDLADLHLAAARNSLYWEMLAQVAQAGRDEGLVGLAAACHPRTLRQMRWTNTMIKDLSPQLLISV